MKQYRLLFCVCVTASLLASCSQPVSSVVWLTPNAGGVVSGTVALRAQALQEPFPANVVFYVDAEPVAKAYEEDGVYNAVWDSKGVSGRVELGAKPYGGEALLREIVVATRSE